MKERANEREREKEREEKEREREREGKREREKEREREWREGRNDDDCWYLVLLFFLASHFLCD